ncbi:MAG: AMP-binding protein [Fluviibacter sp.]
MSLPLILHSTGSEAFAYYEGRLVSAKQYIEDVYSLAAALPVGDHVLNLCSNRYRFLVGFGASILRGAKSLLPTVASTEVLAQLRIFSPDFFVISDHEHSPNLQTYIDPTNHIGHTQRDFLVPQVPKEQIISYVFTSGSTGAPVPHVKQWGGLAENTQTAMFQLKIASGSSVVGTTPSQHMYGFESNILLCMLGKGILCDDKPFFPADIAQSLSTVPSPRILVTTPYHLEKLLDSEVGLPEIERILCATAPLTQNLAARAESLLRTELSEIFGSTETGQIATRRTAQTDEWTLLDKVSITKQDQSFFIVGTHLPEPVELTDTVETTGLHTFKLLGRNKDMVNIAGKRTSIGYLNSILKQITGIKDGIFFLPSCSSSLQQRLALVYVSETLDESSLKTELKRFIDPVFLPRPILKADEIPRNQTGKILQKSLDSLVRSKQSHGA